VVNGEEPSSFDAVPLRRAAPDPDRAGHQATPASDPPTPTEPAAAEPTPTEPAAAPEPAAPEPAAPEPAAPEPAAAEPAAARPGLAPVRHRRPLLLRGAGGARAARGAAAWARRPAGRLTCIGLFITALLGLTISAGAYLVPATVPVDPTRAAEQGPLAERDGAASPSAGATMPDSVPSAGLALPQSATPSAGSSTDPGGRPPVGGAGTRPADVLAGWAQEMSTRVGVPQVALQAYAYAELVIGQTTPACRLSWTTLAAIGKVESNHGGSNNATLYPDGRALPAIVGPVLDGTNGNAAISDTDGGTLDRDSTWDRAVGPMQFIPSTWRSQAVDADNDGIRDPSDIDDAALAAAHYLCANGRDLSTPTGWWQAIAAYNIPQSYGQAVFDAANDYGTRSQN
jgi:Transglycosylase SLT domain